MSELLSAPGKAWEVSAVYSVRRSHSLYLWSANTSWSRLRKEEAISKVGGTGFMECPDRGRGSCEPPSLMARACCFPFSSICSQTAKISVLHPAEYKLSIKASTERLHPHRKCFWGQAECPWSPHGRQRSFSEVSTTRLCGAKGPNPKAGTVAQ